MPAAIEIEGLTKVYGRGRDAVKAVDSLDLTVGEGDVFGFLGPNGAGKTSTVQMLTQIIYPTAGNARLLGKPLGDLGVKAQLGYLPELFQFHPFLRADEFLDFHARLYGMPASQRRQRVAEVLELVGLTDNARSRIRTFSKGMRQRIGIGQAVINNPRLLFLDEPTSALDPLGRRDVRDLLMRLRAQGTTIFLNSHLLSEVEMVCSHIGIMNKGKLVQVSDLQSLIKPVHCVDVRAEGLTTDTVETIRNFAAQVEVNQDSSLTVTLDREDQIGELAHIITSSGADLRQFTPRQKLLEDAFIQAIQESRA